jgi:hypothetical protein
MKNKVVGYAPHGINCPPSLRAASHERRARLLSTRGERCEDCSADIPPMNWRCVPKQLSHPANGLFIHEDEYKFPFRDEHAFILCHNHHMRRHHGPDTDNRFPVYASYARIVERNIRNGAREAF